jgi:type I restriction enzyme, S subunit
MSEKRNVPKLRFEGLTNPWERISLGDISRLITKGTTPKQFHDGEVVYVKIESLNGHVIERSRCASIDESTHHTELKRSILEENDILFAIAGATVGKIGIVQKEILPANTNQALAIIRLSNKEAVNFVFQILTSRVMKNYIYESVSVGAQPNLSLQQISDFSFFVPSLLEQRKIAEFLTAVDRRIELLQAKKEKLEAYKKGVMQKIFAQKLRFKADDGSDFPDWEERKLGEVCEIVKGQQLNRSELFESGEFPALNGGISPSGYTDVWNTAENTIAISEGGNSCGFVSFMKTKFWSGGHCYTVQSLKNGVTSLFLFQILKFNQESIMALRVGSGLPNIQKKDLLKFTVLTSLDRSIENLNQQITHTQTWKKGLLQKMFI